MPAGDFEDFRSEHTGKVACLVVGWSLVWLIYEVVGRVTGGGVPSHSEIDAAAREMIFNKPHLSFEIFPIIAGFVSFLLVGAAIRKHRKMFISYCIMLTDFSFFLGTFVAFINLFDFVYGDMNTDQPRLLIGLLIIFIEFMGAWALARALREHHSPGTNASAT
jgi:hypothetical protein